MGKIDKSMIIDTCLDIIRSEGLSSINSRRIAKELNCSTQPIYYLYKNMDELKKDIYEEIANKYYNYLFNDCALYKDVGKNYIKFARDEPKFFQILFNGDTTSFNIASKNSSIDKVYELISKQTGLSIKDAEIFHLKMWLYVNGIANLVANKTLDFNEDEIDGLLGEQYVSMILLENKRGKISKKIINMVIKDKISKGEL